MNRGMKEKAFLDQKTLYRGAESGANRFNLKCLVIMGGFSILCEILNHIGVFIVEKKTMDICTAVGLTAFLFPVLVWLVHDKIIGFPVSVIEWDGFKYLILFSIYTGIGVYSILLTFHALILLSVPPIFAAQYSDQKKILSWTLLGGVLLVVTGVFGGYYLGLPDRNLFINHRYPDEMLTLDMRIRITTGEDLFNLFVYFVIPRIFGVIAINTLISGIAERNTKMLSRQAELAEKVNVEMEKRNNMLNRVIEDLAALIETRDLQTGEHVVHTRQYVELLAEMLQKDSSFGEEITDQDILEMKSAAPLHDVGKIAISDTILLKPAKLTPEEFEKIKTHTTIGGEMIRQIFSNLDHPHLFQVAEDIVLYHHEKWDGTGYPTGLKGKEIPLAARIMAIADVYDALISVRPYKREISHEEALKIIYSESGTHFDPEIIRIMEEKGEDFFES